MKEDIIYCPGCQVTHPSKNLLPPDNYNVSGECWELYGELTVSNISEADINFSAQHCVDAYAAQHVSKRMKPITIAFSLIGLYLAIEKGYTGRQVQLAHMELGRKKFPWPEFKPPNEPGSINISNVLQAKPGEERKVMIKQWAASVWHSWEKEHDWTKNIVDQLLNIK
jgi:hypothetical protein